MVSPKQLDSLTRGKKPKRWLGKSGGRWDERARRVLRICADEAVRSRHISTTQQLLLAFPPPNRYPGHLSLIANMGFTDFVSETGLTRTCNASCLRDAQHLAV